MATATRDEVSGRPVVGRLTTGFASGGAKNFSGNMPLDRSGDGVVGRGLHSTAMPAILPQNMLDNAVFPPDAHHQPLVGYQGAPAEMTMPMSSFLNTPTPAADHLPSPQFNQTSNQDTFAVRHASAIRHLPHASLQNVPSSNVEHSHPTSIPDLAGGRHLGNSSAQQVHNQAMFPLRAPQTVTESSHNAITSTADVMQDLSVNQNFTPTSDVVNLIDSRTVLPSRPRQPPRPVVRGMNHVRLCHSDVMRPTLLQVPCTKSLLDSCALPFGVLVQPFQELAARDLPLVTFDMIVRCSVCRAYINPFVMFVSSRTWRCSLCNHPNTAPDSFTIAAKQGRSCPEIENCSVEYCAPKEYVVHPPQPVCRVFVIDVTASAVQSGMVEAVCRTILDVLDSMPGGGEMRFALLTFSSQLHFYRLQSSAARAEMMTMVDADEVVLPRPSHEFLGKLDECKEQIRELLHHLPSVHTHAVERDSCFGLAVDAALHIVGQTGGQIIAFQSSLPTVGPGLLSHISQEQTEKCQHLGPLRDYYRMLSLECARQHVSVDLFAFGPQFLGLTSTACLCRHSSGHVFYFSNYHSQHNLVQAKQLCDDLRNHLTRTIGTEAVLRLRCTEGINVEEFLGNHWSKPNNILSLPTINGDLSIGVRFSVTGSLLQKRHLAAIQVALFYTNSQGDRRIRVHTIALPLSANLRTVFDSADNTAIAVLLARMAANRCLSISVNDSRQMVAQTCSRSLHNFRQLLSDSQRAGVPAPQSLLLLPLYCSAILKLVMFQGQESCDKRIANLQLVCQLPTAVCLLTIYPNLYQLHTLSDEHGLTVADGIEYFPAIHHATRMNVCADGVYLLDTGLVLLVWIGHQLSHQIIFELFGVLNFPDIPGVQIGFPEVSMPLARRISMFLRQLQCKRSNTAPVLVMREDSSLSNVFLDCLVDDRSSRGPDSYSDFLLQLQKK